MDFAVRNADAIRKLTSTGVTRRLDYVYKAIRLSRKMLAGQTALLGFAGAPWTLGCFMAEGESSPHPTHLLRLGYRNPRAFDRLMTILTRAVAAHLNAQIRAGANGVQIFDSLAGLVPAGLYDRLSGRWIREVIRQLPDRTPVILFSRGMHHDWKYLSRSGASILSVDHLSSLSAVSKIVPKRIVLQGNLDPVVLTTDPATVRAETKRVASFGKRRRGYIFNLGHGVPPSASVANIAALVETLRGITPA